LLHNYLKINYFVLLKISRAYAFSFSVKGRPYLFSASLKNLSITDCLTFCSISPWLKPAFLNSFIQASKSSKEIVPPTTSCFSGSKPILPFYL